MKRNFVVEMRSELKGLLMDMDMLLRTILTIRVSSHNLAIEFFIEQQRKWWWDRCEQRLGWSCCAAQAFTHVILLSFLYCTA